MNYVRWFPGDYLRDTLHLTWYEDLAYRRLLDVYYTLEKPLPADRELLYKLIRANTAEQRKAVEKVLAEFFTEYGPKSHRFFSQVRARAEVKSYQNWRKQAALNGRKGGRPKKLESKETSTLSETRRKPAPKPGENHPPPPLPTPVTQESRNTLFSQDTSIKPLHSSSAQARKTPFLDGFELDAEMIEFANAKHVDPIPEFDKFRDHHKAKGSLMKDWRAAWRTWVRRSPEFNGGNNGSARPVQKTFDQLRNERTDAALRRVREHYLQGTSKMLT